jgi:hypothetical protein
MTSPARVPMRRCVCALLSGVLTTAAAVASAQTAPVRVEHRAAAGAGEAAAPLDAAAGVGLTLVFRIVNPADVGRTVATRVDSPAGWQVLFASDRMMLSPRASVIDTVTVIPPRDAGAGTYTLRYVAIVAPSDVPVTASVAIRLRERRSLSVSWLSEPGYVAADSAETLELLVENSGNVSETVTLDVRSLLGGPPQLSWAHGTLAPGEVRRARVDIHPRARTGQAMRETLTARATTASTADTFEAGLQFDVVPVGKGLEPRRSHLPTALALRAGSNRSVGFGSFTGGGALNAARTVTADFGFLSHEESHPLMLERDRYYGTITGPSGQLAVGDQTWSMSYLTESGHYGFGAGGRFESQRWFAGAFVDTGRRDIDESRQAAGFVGARLGHTARVSVQYLKRFDDGPEVKAGELGTALLELRPWPGMTGEIEMGTGRSVSGIGNAVSGQIRQTSRVVTAYARRVRADTIYPIRDRTSLIDGFGFSVRPVGQLQVEGTYDGTEQLVDQTLPIDAPTRQRLTRAGVGWGSRVRLQASRRAWTSPGMDWAVGWRRESVSAEIEVPVWRVRLTPGAERGIEASPLYPETRFSLNWLEAKVYLGRRSSVYARGEYGQGVPGDPRQATRRVSFGGSVHATASTSFNFQLHDSGTDAPWLKGTQWTNATLDQRLPWRHHLVANYRRRASGTSFLPSSEAFRVDYVIPLGLPLRQTAGTGRLRVSLRNGDTGGAQANYLVQIAGQSLLSNRDGVADFSGIKPGEYYLTVASESLGPGRTIVPALPLRVSITAGRRMQVNVTVVRTASIKGVLQLFQPASNTLTAQQDQRPALVPAAGVAGAVLELLGNGDRRVAVTDLHGRFAFEETPPGNWRIRVVQVDVPPFYQVAERELTVGLVPGKDIDVVLRVVPKSLMVDASQAASGRPTVPVLPAVPVGGR